MVHYSTDGYLLCNGCAADLVGDEGEEAVVKRSNLKDTQVKCAGCGLRVSSLNGEHINEKVG